MRKINYLRAVAATSVIAMMVTSIPAMAAENDLLSSELQQSEEICTEDNFAQCDFSVCSDELEVLESGIIDSEAPELVDVWFGNSNSKKRSITVSHKEKFDFAASGTDDMSGVVSINASFREFKNNQFVEGDDRSFVLFTSSVNYDSKGDLITYPNGEKHDSTAAVPGDIPPGTYKIEYIEIVDNAGNFSSYDAEADEIPDICKNTTINVSDKVASTPRVKDLIINATSFSVGDTLKFSGNLDSKRSEYCTINLYFINTSNQKEMCVDCTVINGKFFGETKIYQFQDSGNYEFYYACVDTNAAYSEQFGKKYGGSGKITVPDAVSNVKFTVKNTKSDKTAPVLNGLTFLNKTVNVPGTFDFKFDVTEKESGLQYVEVCLVGENGDYMTGVWDNSLGCDFGSVKLNQYVQSGEITVDSVSLCDNAGNQVFYINGDPTDSSEKKLPEKITNITLNATNDDEKEDGTKAQYTTSTILPTNAIVAGIRFASKNAVIHVDYSGNPILKKEVLAEIKGTNKKFLLNSSTIQYELVGKDVTDASKDWNMAATIYDMDYSWLPKFFGSNVTDTPCVVFAENGALPGKTKIRLSFDPGARQCLKDAKNGLYAYTYEETEEEKSHVTTVTLKQVAGPFNLTAENNAEFETATRFSNELFIAPCKASTTKVSYNTYNVVDKFKDVKNAWYTEFVQEAVDRGYMSGTGNGTFKPMDTCTRSQMVQILYNTLGAPYVAGKTPFKDVAQGKWYSNAILWAYQDKVTSGKSATQFGINDPVTREQVAVFLYSFAQANGIDVSASANLSKFSDAGEVSGWAKKGMAWANAKGIVNGTGANTLSPKKTATRAEIATMIVNYINNY